MFVDVSECDLECVLEYVDSHNWPVLSPRRFEVLESFFVIPFLLVPFFQLFFFLDTVLVLVLAVGKAKRHVELFIGVFL
jgi:hypothetical protein